MASTLVEGGEDTTVVVIIKKKLVERGIKLWKPPYYGVSDCDQALIDLAASFVAADDDEQQREQQQQKETKTETEAKNSSEAEAVVSSSIVVEHLKTFRNKAIEKLKSKGKIVEEMNIQVLGGSSQPLSLDGSGSLRNWAESVRLKGPKTIQLNRVNPDLTLHELSKDLASLIVGRGASAAAASAAAEVRLVHKGKTLNTTTTTTTTTNNNNNDSANHALITASDLLAGGEGGSSSCCCKAHVLCLVQKTPAVAAAARRQLPSEQQQQRHDDDEPPSDQDLIDSIRLAAGELDSEMDITDGSGNLISMSHNERTAFYTALGLHAIAKQRMQIMSNNAIMQEQQQKQENASVAVVDTTDNSNNNNSNNNLESALVFLLEADQQWNNLNEAWRNRVDNFSLLQLDICWIYLKFESIDKLPDVIQRLDTAETVLRKQVHTNFLTLALVQAEMDNPVPAVAAIFVRLFLLQGVAQYYQRNVTESKKKLDWAWALAKSLRAVSTPDTVTRLEQALAVTPFQAISALRRTNGDVDRAAGMIQSDKMEAKKAFNDRYKQRKYGLCSNGTDYVNLNTLDELREVLGLPKGDDVRIASGLLRLGNNSFDRALEIFQECLRDEGAVLERVADLDRSQGLTVPRKRSRTSEDDDDADNAAVQVDEMALASLLSMGVDDVKARRALQSNSNNVDLALLSLTNQQDNNSESADLKEEDGVTAMGTENEVDKVTTTTSVTAAGAAFPGSRAVDVEREAVDLLQRVLGEVLDEQHGSGEGYLGSSLDEEWKYIEQYRKDE